MIAPICAMLILAGRASLIFHPTPEARGLLTAVRVPRRTRDRQVLRSDTRHRIHSVCYYVEP